MITLDDTLGWFFSASIFKPRGLIPRCGTSVGEAGTGAVNPKLMAQSMRRMAVLRHALAHGTRQESAQENQVVLMPNFKLGTAGCYTDSGRGRALR
jgi:hypothetical protein